MGELGAFLRSPLPLPSRIISSQFFLSKSVVIMPLPCCPQQSRPCPLRTARPACVCHHILPPPSAHWPPVPCAHPPLPSQQRSPLSQPGLWSSAPPLAGDRASATLCCAFSPAGDVCPPPGWGALSAYTALCRRASGHIEPRNPRKGTHSVPGVCHMNPKATPLCFPEHFLRGLNHDSPPVSTAILQQIHEASAAPRAPLTI